MREKTKYLVVYPLLASIEDFPDVDSFIDCYQCMESEIQNFQEKYSMSSPTMFHEGIHRRTNRLIPFLLIPEYDYNCFSLPEGVHTLINEKRCLVFTCDLNTHQSSYDFGNMWTKTYRNASKKIKKGYSLDNFPVCLNGAKKDLMSLHTLDLTLLPFFKDQKNEALIVSVDDKEITSVTIQIQRRELCQFKANLLKFKDVNVYTRRVNYSMAGVDKDELADKKQYLFPVINEALSDFLGLAMIRSEINS